MSDIQEDDLLSLCTAVGFISINWALVERQMDNIIHLVFDSLGGVPGQKKKPVALSWKIKYLRQAFTKLPALSPFRFRALRLLTDAQDMGGKRHVFMHGTLGGLDGTILHIDKMAVGRPGYVVERTSFDLLQFPALTAELEDLTTQWATLARDVLDDRRSRQSTP